MKKLTKKTRNLKKWIISLIVLIIGLSTGAIITINNQSEVFQAIIQYSKEDTPALVEDDMGEVIEIENIEGEEIKTVEEVDGGRFEDASTGLTVVEGDYDDLGWSEVYNTSSPEAFKNDTLGKCIIANNRYGAQCVSLARVFWWSYANRDVSTCGTGMAKGMMNCATQNAGKEFKVFWGNDNIQAGDWLVFTGGKYGHIGMALGPVKDGYVALLGENQGGRYCTGGGGATNIINISIKNLIGGYRPKAYIKPAPKPTPKPTPIPAPQVNPCQTWNVEKGDTMAKIMQACTGKVEWGAKMNEYAAHWFSTKVKKFNTVFDGWVSESGYGLFAGDTIEYRK